MFLLNVLFHVFIKIWTHTACLLTRLNLIIIIVHKQEMQVLDGIARNGFQEEVALHGEPESLNRV